MSLTKEQKNWIRNLETDGETYLGVANETAFYDKESGSVETDIQGLNRYRYKSIDDFIENHINHNFVPHEHSIYIGERNMETGKISFNENYDPDTMSIDEDEDGSSVYSDFVSITQ
jgi:hypothetical protein